MTQERDRRVALLPAGFGDGGTVAVRPWLDALIDTVGFDPRAAYVERFWLGVLGPSTTWLLRRIASAFDAAPDGFDLPLGPTARQLGLGDKGGRHSPFLRAVGRCVQFDLARVGGEGLEVRRHLPPLNRRQLLRLPAEAQAEHAGWQQARLGAAAAATDRRRARALAQTLLEVDTDPGEIAARLTAWGVHPAVAGDAVAWASAHRPSAPLAALSGG